MAALLILALAGVCVWYFTTHRLESDRLPLHTTMKMTRLARAYAVEKYGDVAEHCETDCSYQNGEYEVQFKKVHNGFIVGDLFTVYLENDGTPVRVVGKDPVWYEDFDPGLVKDLSKSQVLSWAEEELQKKVDAGEIFGYRLEDRFILRQVEGQYGISLEYQYKFTEESREGEPDYWGFPESLFYPLG